MTANDFSPRRFLSCLGLSSKLALVFGIGIVTTACIAFILFDAMSKQRQAYENLLFIESRIQLSATDAMKNFLDARRAEKDFLLRHDKQYVDKNQEALKETLEAFKTVSDLAGKRNDTSHEALVAEALESVNKYSSKFVELSQVWEHKGLNEESGMQGEFRKAVHALEKSIAGIEGVDTKDVMIALLQARRSEKDYLLRQQPEYAKKLEAAVEKNHLRSYAALVIDLRQCFICYALSAIHEI